MLTRRLLSSNAPGHSKFGWKEQRLTAGKGILENLLEAQEFEDGEVDSGVKSKTAFVGTQSRVELHTVTAVDLDLVLVVFPDHTELDDSFRDGSNL